MNNNNLLINCQRLRKLYYMGAVEVAALRDIDLQVQHGEYLAILGPSGSGKSTLMNILGCLDQPSDGHYYLENEDVGQLTKKQLARIRNRKIGFVFQSFHLLPHATALENVALPLVYRGMSLRERNERAEQVLTQVGLQDRLQHMPNELSGGQRQRVAIARALVTEPQLILADEPTGNLDSVTGQAVMELFENFCAAGKTVIIVTHDLTLAKRTQRVIRIKDGLIYQNEVFPHCVPEEGDKFSL